jgi:hypothetical protein
MLNLETNGELHGFSPSIHTMYGTVRDVAVKRGWNGRDPFVKRDDGPHKAVGTWISGTVHLDDDSVTVIGAESPATKTLSFFLRGYAEPEDLAAEWLRIKSNRGDWRTEMEDESATPERAALVQYLRNVFADFDERPPSTYIGFSKAEWEIGTEDAWILECSVPKTVVDTIAGDCHAGCCRRLTIAVTLSPSLTDNEHAPPSVAVTHGVLRLGKYDDGHALGWVRSLSWQTVGPTSAALVGTDANSLTDEDDLAPSLSDQPKRAYTNDPLGEVAALAKTVRRGFILLLVLIGIIALLR